jgi:hypothetical protein
MTSAPRPRTTAWAIALVVAVTALATQMTAQVGRAGCIRHPDTLGVAGPTAPELGEVAHDDAPHAPCALCAAAAPGSLAPTGDAAPAIAVLVATPAPGLTPIAVARIAGPPLDYAPKTSPPIA